MQLRAAAVSRFTLISKQLLNQSANMMLSDGAPPLKLAPLPTLASRAAEWGVLLSFVLALTAAALLLMRAYFDNGGWLPLSRRCVRRQLGSAPLMLFQVLCPPLGGALGRSRRARAEVDAGAPPPRTRCRPLWSQRAAAPLPIRAGC